MAAASHGLGIESLLLIGTAFARAHLVWNAGFFIDPDPDTLPGRPTGLELGVDMDFDVTEKVSLQASCSGVYFLSEDPNQGLVTAGVTWSPFDTLDLSVVAMLGILEGSDRYGVLLGVSPKFRLFR